MRKIRLLILISIILFSCSNENYFEGAVENESIESPKLKSYGDGRFDVLGFGYDITDQYLNGGSVRAQVVDVDKLFKQGFITEKDFGNSVDASGLIFSSSSMSQKLGWALGAAFTGWIMFLFKYNPDIVEQGAKTILGERLMISLIPAACCILAFIGMISYPLTEKKVNEISAELEKRRIEKVSIN
jgi:hypothetical protein